MSDAVRSAMLGRIRGALGTALPLDETAKEAGWDRLAREYSRTPRLSLPERLDLLEERLRDYDAEVTRAAEGEVAHVLTAILAARGNQLTLVPPGFRDAWLPREVPLTFDEELTIRQLDQFEGVLTEATLAIAETGTFVLQSVPGQGRRAATLIPDFHLCVVRAADVVEGVPEAFARLAGTATLPTTFVSGPSATADIEMTRIKGVHGPRFLHVVIAT